MSAPVETTGYVHVHTCPNELHCWHRSIQQLTTNPPTPIDVCCDCGRQVFRYDQVVHARNTHGPYLPCRL